jgi:hypothetical protein
LLDLGDDPLAIEEQDTHIRRMAGPREIIDFLKEKPGFDGLLLIAVSRNLMKNYLALSALLFSERARRLTFLPIIHAGQRISPFKAFLFGREPHPVSRVDAAALRELMDRRRVDQRRFLRIPVEFVAFVARKGKQEQIPVVCRNISWDGTYFETKRDLKFDDFLMVLRSRLHKIELPARIIRRHRIETPPRRYGYGVRFDMPLPLTLIQYMFMKYMKDTVAPAEEGSREREIEP